MVSGNALGNRGLREHHSSIQSLVLLLHLFQTSWLQLNLLHRMMPHGMLSLALCLLCCHTATWEPKQINSRLTNPPVHICTISSRDFVTWHTLEVCLPSKISWYVWADLSHSPFWQSGTIAVPCVLHPNKMKWQHFIGWQVIETMTKVIG